MYQKLLLWEIELGIGVENTRIYLLYILLGALRVAFLLLFPWKRLSLNLFEFFPAEQILLA